MFNVEAKQRRGVGVAVQTFHVRSAVAHVASTTVRVVEPEPLPTLALVAGSPNAPTHRNPFDETCGEKMLCCQEIS